MYIPAAFLETRVDVMHALIRSQPLGWLVSGGPGGLAATPVPFLLYPEEGPNGTLRAHLARANGQWPLLAETQECLALFLGQQGYVTPSWYPSKLVNEQVVPTWNYIVVQAWGKPTVTEDSAWLQRLLEDLTNAQEQVRPQPWAVSNAPEAFIEKQKGSIIGIEIPISRMEGKWKLSQNRNPEDRAGVVAGMGDEADAHHNPALADLVDQRRKEG
jgi:transcriptional regulator